MPTTKNSVRSKCTLEQFKLHVGFASKKCIDELCRLLLPVSFKQIENDSRPGEFPIVFVAMPFNAQTTKGVKIWKSIDLDKLDRATFALKDMTDAGDDFSSIMCDVIGQLKNFDVKAKVPRNKGEKAFIEAFNYYNKGIYSKNHVNEYSLRVEGVLGLMVGFTAILDSYDAIDVNYVSKDGGFFITCKSYLSERQLYNIMEKAMLFIEDGY